MLLIERLKVRDHLRNDGCELPCDLSDIRLTELPLLAPRLRSAECSLERRDSSSELAVGLLLQKLVQEILGVGVLALPLPEAAGETAELSALSAPAVAAATAVNCGGVLASLALKQAHDLRNDGQNLAHDLVHILLGELAWPLSVRALRKPTVTVSGLWLLCLREDLRQQREKLTDNFTDILLR